jgi:8-oxo-dGTP pyrophosphatase MutT (NUDIX family)
MTDWTDPAVISTIGVGVVTVAATIWGAWWAVTRDKGKKPDLSQPTVAVGIVEKDHEVILVRRCKSEQGILWQFPAGMINPKRSAAETVVREVAEETGVTCLVVSSGRGAKFNHVGFISGGHWSIECNQWLNVKRPCSNHRNKW